MEEKQILVNNLKVNYKIAGEGPAILVLHGWGGSSGSWNRLQEILAQKGYQVVIPDFPGFGKSVTPREPWSLQNYTEFITNFIQQLKLENFYL